MGEKATEEMESVGGSATSMSLSAAGVAASVFDVEVPKNDILASVLPGGREQRREIGAKSGRGEESGEQGAAERAGPTCD